MLTKYNNNFFKKHKIYLEETEKPNDRLKKIDLVLQG